MNNLQLNHNIRRYLKQIQEKLQFEQTVIQKPTQWTRQLKAWCDTHDIDCDIIFNSTQMIFSPLHLKQINHALKQLNQPPLEQDYQTLNRFEQADISYEEHKNLGKKPLDNRILINLKQPLPSALAIHNAPSSTILDVDWQILDLSAFANLLVVENLDSFYALYDYHTIRYQLPDVSNSLIVYRGHNYYGKSINALLRHFAQSQRDCIYFGDFDSKGLNIAISEHYSHVLLPTLADLKQSATKAHSDAKQHGFFASVEQFYQQLPDSNPSKTLLAIHCEELKSLKQQWFHGQLYFYPLGKNKL